MRVFNMGFISLYLFVGIALYFRIESHPSQSLVTEVLETDV